jgi:hypothetical protein
VSVRVHALPSSHGVPSALLEHCPDASLSLDPELQAARAAAASTQ